MATMGGEMMKFGKRWLFWNIVALVIAFPVSSIASENLETIHIATPEWEETTNKDGTGVYFDIIRSVYEPGGIQLKYEIVPWNRAISLIKTHQADALPGGYFVGNREDVDDLFPRYPIDTEIASVVYKKDTVTEWKGPESLAGKKVLWLRGYNYDNYLEVKVEFDEIDERKQAWRLLDAGRYDFYMDALYDIEAYIDQNNVAVENYKIQPVIYNNLYLRFANTPKSKKLIELYDQRIPELLASGELEQIFKKWNLDMIPFEPREE
jgi:polar amino acid transport system substrate-binding protein